MKHTIYVFGISLGLFVKEECAAFSIYIIMLERGIDHV